MSNCLATLATYTVTCCISTCPRALALTYRAHALETAMGEFRKHGWRQDKVSWFCPDHRDRAERVDVEPGVNRKGAA